MKQRAPWKEVGRSETTYTYTCCIIFILTTFVNVASLHATPGTISRAQCKKTISSFYMELQQYCTKKLYLQYGILDLKQSAHSVHSGGFLQLHVYQVWSKSILASRFHSSNKCNGFIVWSSWLTVKCKQHNIKTACSYNQIHAAGCLGDVYY